MADKIVKLEEAIAVGITTETTNKDGQTSKDINNLWNRFFLEGVNVKIKNTKDNEILNIYHDYESDHNGPYKVTVGRRVSKPEEKLHKKGLQSVVIPASKYMVFTAKGKLPDCVTEMWEFINAMGDEIRRAYTADFDVYGTKSADPNNATVDIYVAIKSYNP